MKPTLSPRPVHVVYGGAHLFKEGAPEKIGRLARSAMDAHGQDAARFARTVGLADASLAEELAMRVREKLGRAPVEAMCIDFEDGYGLRPDDEEDADAMRSAGVLARTSASASAGAPIVGMRVKAMSGPTTARATRTLDLFVRALAAGRAGGDGGAGGASLPRGFTVTLPKVAHPDDVTALVAQLEALETSLGLEAGAIGVELMIETPRALLDDEGRVALPAIVRAAAGRCVAAHLGAYDLTASIGVTAIDQRMDHPVCDAARVMMQLALAGTGVAVVDGVTTVLPVGASGDAVHDAWKIHATNVRRALAMGIYEGWDVHPAQLPARYGALHAFFLEGRAAMAARLAGFVERATKATRSGQVFDDAATGQGLLQFFVRGVACGALSDDDVAKAGLTTSELASRSFADIVAARS